MRIGFDPAKREWTLEHRGLDFEDAAADEADGGRRVADAREPWRGEGE